MLSVLETAIEKVRLEMGDQVHLKPRDFFAVHAAEGYARFAGPIRSYWITDDRYAPRPAAEAALGAKVVVPTPKGTVAVTVPAGRTRTF